MGDDIPDLTSQCKKQPCPVRLLMLLRKYLKLPAIFQRIGGGKGCVRDVIEKLLRLHGKWDLESFVPSR